MGATDSVDLSAIGRAHEPEEHLVPLAGIGWQLITKEVGAFRGTASQQHAADAVAHGEKSARCQHDRRHSDQAY